MQQKVYKLTKKDRTTYGGFLYKPNKVYTFPGRGLLCTSAYSHAYKTPELAVLFNPVHASIEDPYLLFECEGIIEKDDGTKLGLTQITVPLLPITAPEYSALQFTAWGIGSVYKRYLSRSGKDTVWIKWASNWLLGSDRSSSAACAAARAANSAVYATSSAAYAAACAANSAVYADPALYATYGAAGATHAADSAAHAAVYAAAIHAAGAPAFATVALWAKKHSYVWDINTLGSSKGWDYAKSME